MLGKLKEKTISRPASPKAGSAAVSTGARLIGASRALYIPVVGREIQKYLDKGPNAGKTSSENSKGEQSPSSPVHTGVLQNRVGTSDPTATSTSSEEPYNGLSPWEEAILGVPETKVGFTKKEAETQGHKDFIDGLITEIDKYNTDINNRRWFRINDKGEKIFFVEKVIFQLERYAQIGDVAIQHNPDVVALVWAGFRFLLQIGSAYTKDMQTVTEGIELIVCSICECHIFERLYLRPRLDLGAELRKSLVKFYISILDFLVYGKSYLSRDTTDRVIESFSSELTPLTDKMRKALAEVKSKVDVVRTEWEAKWHDDISQKLVQIRQALLAIEKPLGDIELKHWVEKLYDEVQGRKRLEILQWLSDVPFRDHHTFNSQRRQEDTGQWLLKNKSFLEWRNSNQSSILWMRGDAGSGKTLLASFIIDEFQAITRSSNEHIMAYFYCDYKEPARSDRESILRAIVKQLCLKGPTTDHIPNLVAEMYSIREEDGFSSGKLRVSESTELIVKLAGMYSDVTIIMDGIDECDRKTRAELFSAINEMSKADSKVKIILTGRYDNDIERMFSTAHKHYLTAKDNTEDIIKYVETQMEKRCDPTRGDTVQLILNGVVPADLKQEIIDTLCEKSNGMFMWVHLQLLALCEENTPGDIRQALKELPKDLNATYDQILKRIAEKGPRSERVANFVLRWLVYAQSVCSTQTVIQALAIRPGSSELDENLLWWEVGYILGACQSLVVHDDVLDNFQFAHFSVKEYLQRHPRFADVETSQTLIAEVCLTAHVQHSTEGGEEEKVKELLRYSSQHWPAHARLSGPAGFEKLRPLWIDFFESSPVYNYWIRIAAQVERSTALEGFGSDDFVTPLWAMCSYELLPIAKYLLQRGDNPNSKSSSGTTPLNYAAMENNYHVARMLMENENVDINEGDWLDGSPLMNATIKGSIEVVEMLLERKDLRVNDTSRYGEPALTYAIQENQLGVLRLLLKREDLLVNGSVGEWSKRTPLGRAVVGENVQAVRLLLGRQDLVMFSELDNDNHTPLTWAQSRGYSEIALLLSRRFGVESGPNAPPTVPGTPPGAPCAETEDKDRTDWD
ncbi:hypothetical protein P167DRAFT_605061 [Morchella conica CCBAS932]|uniref:Uncharacterized protein n=1 Tax=Morchella conica CCBAS932 TaxID=1392247 RepID=A0A3N4KSC7_9PEZI|nr:hypothetical protein P167DRAFT_605061 [Morchella conica CCBAS932]